MTVIAFGFPVALVLAWAFELTPEGIKRTGEVPREQSISRSTGRKLDFAIITVLGFAVALLLFDRFRPERSREKSGIFEKSIAVLPFENASNDPNAEYLAEGISEALINSLTELQQLKVIARSSAFHYKGKDVDPRQVGRELKVTGVLTGKVRQDAGRSERAGGFGGRGHRRAALGNRLRA